MYIRLIILLLIFNVMLTFGANKRTYTHSHRSKAHTHHKPKVGNKDSVLKDKELIHDKEHIKEELPDYMSPDDVDNMSESELDYHYFKSHDLDNNKMLDGLELMYAISHAVEVSYYDIEKLPIEMQIAEKAKRIENFHKNEVPELEEMVDHILKEGDLNRDGFVTYGEYIRVTRHS